MPTIGRNRRNGLNLPHDHGTLGVAALTLLTVTCGLLAWFVSGSDRWAGLLPALAVAGIGTTVLLAKSLSDFSQTGPRIRSEVATDYRRHTLYALARLGGWAFALMALTGGGGVLAYYALGVSMGWPWSSWLAAFAATLGLVGAMVLQFVHKLRVNPGLIVASMHYRMSRLYPVWEWATLGRIRLLRHMLAYSATLLLIAASWRLLELNRPAELVALWAAAMSYAGLIAWAAWSPDARPQRSAAGKRQGGPPNILLVGSDTLRADRLGALGYRRSLTPNIDGLAAQGALFANCYVPCARTAPSLISLLTGTWPHTHGIRDNFVADTEARLKVEALPQLLKPHGYRAAALSDWCGSDMGKFAFGFDYTDLPEDQWNLKYLIRQGPKDLRLFVSLFTHNRLGRLLLPELYYLGGVPLTTEMGRRARRLISRLGASAQPFFLNVFFSTTHPPFASEWPWYTRFADPAYAGESKFAMAKLNDPFDIIRRQGAPREEFDLDQIIDLYDGAVAQFDDEVGRMLRHLEACGLANDTIVVVYSDHGMEFFEHDTWGQGNSAVGDFSARIPLVIRDPRHAACGTVADVVRSIDLAPTLLELVGASPAAGMDGVSLAPCLSRGEPWPRLDAFNETGIWITDVPGLPEKHLRYPDLLELLEVPARARGTLALKEKYVATILAAKDRMLRSGRWKLVYQPLEIGYQLRLFDVENDPGCMHDVIGSHPELAQSLSYRLRQWMKPEELTSVGHESPASARFEGVAVSSTRANLRRQVLTVARAVIDWAFALFNHRTHVLFVLTDGYGFACQSPVIHALRQYPDVLVRVTTDRPLGVEELEFATQADRDLFSSLRLSNRNARWKKWHMVVNTHMNSFYPAFNALLLYMHHGPGFGILGDKTGPITQSQIFCGLSSAEFEWFERLQPGLFNEKRLFFPVGFPKGDALCRGDIDRKAVLARLRLPDRTTILLTSHWQAQATLRCLNEGPVHELAAAFPDCNIVQTGHPWLWQPAHNIPLEWQRRVVTSLKDAEAQHPNVRFVQTSDVEALLAAADLLVGDYSSVMTSYSLLDRPIVFFDNPDFRFTFADLKDVFVEASHTFASLDELVSACRAALASPMCKAKGRARMRRIFFANEGKSAAYLADLMHTIGRVSLPRGPKWERVRALARNAT